MDQKLVDRATAACEEWAKKLKTNTGAEPTLKERIAFAIGYARAMRERGRN